MRFALHREGWHPWFAWYPVYSVFDRCWLWLETVDRYWSTERNCFFYEPMV